MKLYMYAIEVRGDNAESEFITLKSSLEAATDYCTRNDPKSWDDGEDCFTSWAILRCEVNAPDERVPLSIDLARIVHNGATTFTNENLA